VLNSLQKKTCTLKTTIQNKLETKHLPSAITEKKIIGQLELFLSVKTKVKKNEGLMSKK